MLFSDLVQVLEQIRPLSGRLEKVQILYMFLRDQASITESAQILELLSGNLFRIIGKRKIAFSTRSIIDVAARTFAVPQEEIEGELLVNGDIAEVIRKVAQEKKQKGQGLIQMDLSLEDIYAMLRELASYSGTSAQEKKRYVMEKMLHRCKHDVEVMYCIKIMLGNLNIGMASGAYREVAANLLLADVDSMNRICSECSYESLESTKCVKCGSKEFQEASKAYEDDQDFIQEKRIHGDRAVYGKKLTLFDNKYHLVNSYVSIIEQYLEDPMNLLNHSLLLGNPCSVMLGPAVDNLEEALEQLEMPFLADFKYDGLRVQIHKSGKDVWIFSRNLEEMTGQFPDVVDAVKQLKGDIVFDGECVGYDRESEEYIPFQQLSKQFLAKNVTLRGNIMVKLFDILYYNGETLLTKEYKERRELLEKVLLNQELQVLDD